MNTATIKNWAILRYRELDIYTAPEIRKSRLYGRIHGDSAGRYPDDTSILTSAITGISDLGSHKLVFTKSTQYTVYPEDIDPAYEKAFPGAYERLRIDNARQT